MMLLYTRQQCTHAVIFTQEALLEVQQQERTDTEFQRGCLFCPESFVGNRSLVFQHMLETHNFNIGLADNIGLCTDHSHTLYAAFTLMFECAVFVKEYLDTLQHKLDRLDSMHKSLFHVNTLSFVSVSISC